jgi:hypothetical protein
MIHIDFPQHNFRIKKENNRHLIFDEVRRTWVTLTPEEWVRQNFLQYLIKVKNYAAAVISVEKMIKVGELKKRYDIVVYKNNAPWLIVECKENNTAINIAVVEQVLRYNMALAIKYFVLTNGSETYVYEIAASTFRELNELPQF